MDMQTLIATWSAPDDSDRDEFEKHYREVHAPLAAEVPNLQKLVTTRTDQGMKDADPDFYRVAEMMFESLEALHEAEKSDEWEKVRKDAGEIIERFDVELNVGIGEKQTFNENR